MGVLRDPQWVRARRETPRGIAWAVAGGLPAKMARRRLTVGGAGSYCYVYQAPHAGRRALAGRDPGPQCGSGAATYGYLPPADAKYFAQVSFALGLNPVERFRLNQTGFIETDRLAFENFQTAYAYIYWKDLPVLITTNSLLQVVHQNYDTILSQMETSLLAARLAQLLAATRRQAQADAAANGDPELARLYTDLDTYLAVPLALLAGSGNQVAGAADPGAVATYTQLARGANQVERVALFGSHDPYDFTLFKPRGHYTRSPALSRYFAAVTWLSQIDFRLVSYAGREAILQPQALAGAAMFRLALDRAGQRAAWSALDTLFGAFVGPSDNTTLPDLDRFLTDAGLTTPAAALRPPDPARALALLSSGAYGQHRITGQLLTADPSDSQPQARPISFLLLGARFSINSEVMSRVVYDRLLAGGKKVERALPSSLDVMYALGSDRAEAHLEDEIARYGYSDTLHALRREVAAESPAFWSGSFYNRWLGALRTLNTPTTGPQYPAVMHSAAWADKMLQTQLASWAQLRHDNILYVKQSVTEGTLCSYPAGYVEPYPAFYAALRDYAQAGRALFAGLPDAGFPDDTGFIGRAVANFALLESAAAQLETLADKELRLEPFTADEEAFLKNTTVYQMPNPASYPIKPAWDGWYPNLFYGGDASPALIADVHTDPVDDPTSPLYPPRVLHVATGPVAALLFIANTDEGRATYVGPAYTYYETVEQGFPPVRLTDADWQARLAAFQRPAPPAWTSSFRLAADHPPTLLAPAALQAKLTNPPATAVPGRQAP